MNGQPCHFGARELEPGRWVHWAITVDGVATRKTICKKWVNEKWWWIDSDDVQLTCPECIRLKRLAESASSTTA